jgi:diacylglycerol kinase
MIIRANTVHDRLNRAVENFDYHH